MLRERLAAPSDASSSPGFIPGLVPHLPNQDGVLREAEQGVFQLPGAQDPRKFVLSFEAIELPRIAVTVNIALVSAELQQPADNSQVRPERTRLWAV
jgi:hypothetical protein